jgi:hypothetical protein
MELTPKTLQAKTIKSNLLALGLIALAGVGFLSLFNEGKHESILICKNNCVQKRLVAVSDLTRAKWGKDLELERTKQGWLIPKGYRVISHFPPENRWVWIRSLISTALAAAGCGIYANHTKKLIFDYPQYFEQLRTEINRQELVQGEIRRQDSEAIAQGNIPSEFEILELQKQAEKEQELINEGHKLQLSQLQLETAKNQKELDKLSKPEKTKSASAQSASDEKRQELVKLLQEHEGGWLWEIVDTLKPTFLLGSQGAGKSYFAASLALCKLFINQVKVASLTDPHFNKNREKGWKKLIPLEPEVYGGAQDWEAVSEGIEQGFNRWTCRTEDDPPITSIWDEATNWAKHEECKKQAEEFMGRVLADPRKSAEGPIVITHSLTNAGTGGGAGFAEARGEGIIVIRLNANNKQKPTFKGKCEGLKDEDGSLIEEMQITIPKWFNPESIAEMFEVKK